MASLRERIFYDDSSIFPGQDDGRQLFRPDPHRARRRRHRVADRTSCEQEEQSTHGGKRGAVRRTGSAGSLPRHAQ